LIPASNLNSYPVPELPEVETVVRSISPHITGHTIVHAEVFSHRVTRAPFGATAKALTGARIESVRRRGKQIFVHLNRGVLYIHLGMTGKLLWNSERTKYARAIIELDNGTLIFDDVRQFGRVEHYPRVPDFLAKTGPDALTVSAAEFLTRLKRHTGHIKPLLLNQSFIGGVGNIYADESLFAARIHPRAHASRLSKARAEELHRQILAILELAIQHRGSTISNYVDADGASGNYQSQHNVYGRTGEPCPRCGTSVKRIVLGQRGTHYCPHCQRS
jgi:formamidopyrimidine-DNA glycosylase